MIYAVIVTYHPDLSAIASLIDRLVPQVEHIVVVDNASSDVVVKELGRLLSTCSSTLIRNSVNKGVAEAVTQGVKIAREQKATYTVLFDQDSLPADDMVGCLRSALELKQQHGEKVAAVGPAYRDVKGQHRSPFVQLKGCRLKRVDCAAHELVAVDHLITSGSFVSLSALEDIGEMESQLFIDYVDTEWCLRARAKGYQLYGVSDAQMKHDLGEGLATFMGRKLPVQSSIRYYYMIRNGIWTLRRPWVTLEWRLMDAQRLLLIYIVYSFFLGDRFSNWKMMTRGLWHGLTEKMGKLD